MTNTIKTDVLIIGCGVAGGVAALELADSGVSVTVITKASQPQESNTNYAQGGIIYKGHHDSPRLLAEDVVRAGAGYNNRRSVAILAEQGPKLVEQLLLDRVGVQFDQNGVGLSLAREGGHSLPRIIHAADATGRAISTALIEALQSHPNVTLLNQYTAIDLIKSVPPGGQRHSGYNSAACVGAYLLDQKRQRVTSCLAKTTILATGGLGQVYRRTTNPAGARGDGVAMAYRAGAHVQELEFVQFHPTTLAHPEAGPFLISEAVRGAGARLVDPHGNPFMQKYNPEWKDLAPRDVVARAIHREMAAWDAPYMYLDLHSYLPAPEIRQRFPNIYDYCLDVGIDITADLIPVSPAAHYACGGIWVDEWAQTSIEGLFAVGEAARTGVHGANRLASTSLLEGVVWGYRAAQLIQRQVKRQVNGQLSEFIYVGNLSAPPADPLDIQLRLNLIQDIMWRHVGLVRETAGLERAVSELNRLTREVEQLYQTHRLTDDLVGLRNIAQVAKLIAGAALANWESVGCHYRPESSAELLTFTPVLDMALG